MPGKSYRGELPPLTEDEARLSAALRRHVDRLGGEIGPRNLDRPEALERAAAYIESTFAAQGHSVERQVFRVGGKPCANLEVEVLGGERAAEVVVVGAHYDSWTVSPGANDNGTGVAALLELADRCRSGAPFARTLRWVAFTNEEPPYFKTRDMGSRVYARRCRERDERITAMIAFDTIGCFSDAPRSQAYPAPFSFLYPTTGDFIAFVGDLGSAALVRRVVGAFREHAHFPSQGAALPSWVPGVDWSDHGSFSREGYPGVMVTDTGPYRYPFYHTADDTPDKVDDDRLARVVAGIELVIRELCSG